MDKSSSLFSEQLNRLIFNEEIQPVFALSKEIKEIARGLANQQEKDGYILLLNKIKAYLIPWISTEEFNKLVRFNLLLSVKSGIDLKNRFFRRIDPYPETSQDDVRLEILKELVKNDEKVNGIKITELLQNYEEFVSFKKGTSMDRNNFIQKNEEAKGLEAQDQKLLLATLDLFDFLKPDFDYKDELKFSTTTRSTSEKTTAAETKIKLSLSQALQKYPRLGEQLVTASPIKLKIFPDPARPSVKNWIAEYHAVLGAGTHGTMERGNFLYHSENARRLSFGERQKLAVILKSLDENEPVAVDTEKQEIVFASSVSPHPSRPERRDTLSPPAGVAREMLGKHPLPSGEDARRAGEGDDFRFSYPQKLQSEQPRPKSYQHFDPYHIDPVGYPEDRPKPEPPRPPVPPSAPRTEPRINGNIVDLRN